MRSSSSYLSQGAAALHFGLGTSTSARITVHWPAGGEQVLETVASGQLVLLIEGQPPRFRSLRPTPQ